mmetsp:Transcript_107244/g.282770  ORF Transcript_107244/g.282770 Transcript_107244/m.282770 type:complete len:270 (-) Transcript_107244:203-1012(-)
MVLCAVPPRGVRRPHRHGVPLPSVPHQHLQPDPAGDHDPVLAPEGLSQGARPRLGRTHHRPGGRVRLLRQPGHQGPSRVRRVLHRDQPQHRDRADLVGLRRPGVLPARHRGVRDAGDPARAPRRHPVLLRRPDGAQLRHPARGGGRAVQVRRQGAGNTDQSSHHDRRPRAVRQGGGPLRIQGCRERLLHDRGGSCGRRGKDRLSSVGPCCLRPRRPRQRLCDGRGRAETLGACGAGEQPAGHRRQEPERLEGARVRGRARRERQLHHGV